MTCFDKTVFNRVTKRDELLVLELPFFKIFFWWYCQYSSGICCHQCCRSLQLYIMLNFVFRHHVSWKHPSSKTGSSKFETFLLQLGTKHCWNDPWQLKLTFSILYSRHKLVLLTFYTTAWTDRVLICLHALNSIRKNSWHISMTT